MHSFLLILLCLFGTTCGDLLYSQVDDIQLKYVYPSGIYEGEFLGSSRTYMFADDFIVPAGVTWQIDTIRTRGYCYDAVTNFLNFALEIYDAQDDVIKGTTLPGVLLHQQYVIPANAFSENDPNPVLVLNVSDPLILQPGHYYFTVYPRFQKPDVGPYMWLRRNSSISLKAGTTFRYRDYNSPNWRTYAEIGYGATDDHAELEFIIAGIPRSTIVTTGALTTNVISTPVAATTLAIKEEVDDNPRERQLIGVSAGLVIVVLIGVGLVFALVIFYRRTRPTEEERPSSKPTSADIFLGLASTPSSNSTVPPSYTQSPGPGKQSSGYADAAVIRPMQYTESPSPGAYSQTPSTSAAPSKDSARSSPYV